ncbi:hypothetical protein H6G21_02770 [Alkalinema sp. FACHB-956]|nr:hypothetical protein [Alkalinema sp. FACHB-956]
MGTRTKGAADRVEYRKSPCQIMTDFIEIAAGIPGIWLDFSLVDPMKRFSRLAPTHCRGQSGTIVGIIPTILGLDIK